MSDASEVKRFIHWFSPDYDGSAQFSQEVVLASDFDRIVADLRIKIRSLNLEIETRAKPTVEKLKNEITNLKAEVEVLKNHRAEYEADCKRIEYFDDLHDKAARQARVIEKLKLQRGTILHEKYAGFPLLAMNAESDLDKELEAIEKEGAKDDAI